jgi:hypothetical protein
MPREAGHRRPNAGRPAGPTLGFPVGAARRGRYAGRRPPLGKAGLRSPFAGQRHAEGGGGGGAALPAAKSRGARKGNALGGGVE